MSIGARVLLGYVLVLGLSSFLLLNSALDAIKPAMRQSAEETLVETANLLALLVADGVKSGTVGTSEFAHKLEHYTESRLNANIWGIAKAQTNHRIYITDATGRVLIDSSGRDVGADFSRWNDVYLTLRGHYGARTTQAVPGDESSTVMYVAAPVFDGAQIIGVLSVAKPNGSMQPFIDRGRRQLLIAGVIALIGAIIAGIVMSWWTTRSVRALAHYAHAASNGARIALPRVAEPELAALGAALEDMRERLDGKAYIEQYVQTLTHELKSALAAIIGASEVLRYDLAPAERARFLTNIGNEAARIQQLIERLLDLAQVEQRRSLDERVSIPLAALVASVCEAQAAVVHAQELTIAIAIPTAATVTGGAFLLRQACTNILDNALAFTSSRGVISYRCERGDDLWAPTCHNTDPQIPDYALPQLTDRFFSLPRPRGGRKSSGLGLSFVAEVAALHQGHLTIENRDGGVATTLSLPAP